MSGLSVGDIIEDGRIKESVKISIRNVRSLMVMLKRSSKQRDILRQHTPLAPVLDVQTRWNSTLAMVKRFNRI